MKKSRHLIFGSNGFLGKNFKNFLLKKNYHKIYLSDLKKNNNKNYYYCDIANFKRVYKIIKTVKPKYIWNFSGILKGSFKNLCKVNVIGSINIMKAILQLDPNIKLILIGSAAEDNFDNKSKKFYYGLSKRMQKFYFDYYTRKYKLNLYYAKIYNIYGEGISSDLLPGKIYNNLLLKKKKIIIYNPNTTRNYIRLKDVLKKIYLILKRSKKQKIYNIKSNRSIKNIDLFKKIVEELKCVLSISYSNFFENRKKKIYKKAIITYKKNAKRF